METIKSIIQFVGKQNSFSLVILTASIEQLFSSVAFQCPCNQLNFIYSLVFLLVPALVLMTLGFIFSDRRWRLVQGLHCDSQVNTHKDVIQISTFVLLAPSTWIAVALLKGDYIKCAMTGTNMTLYNDHLCKGREMEADCLKELHTFPCGKDGKVPKDERDDVLHMLRAESQIVGWLLILTMILSRLAFHCVEGNAQPTAPATNGGSASQEQATNGDDVPPADGADIKLNQLNQPLLSRRGDKSGLK